IICLDDPNIQMIIPQISRRVITYGMRAHAEISASEVRLSRENFGSEFVVRRKGEELGRIKLNVPGEHNVINALATVAVGLDLEVDFPVIAEGLEAVPGAERRVPVKRGGRNGKKGDWGGGGYSETPTEGRGPPGPRT